MTRLAERLQERLRPSTPPAATGTVARVPSRSAADASQYTVTLNSGNAYAAVIFSTPVANSDNDGILNAWKTGPSSADFFAGQPGYYDVKTQSWVPLPGAKHGEKDLFVQLDWMCGAVLSNGVCDPSQENLFPSPDADGNDPLAMVQQAFASDRNRAPSRSWQRRARKHLHRQSRAALPVPRRAGSDRLEEQPGILQAVAAQFHFLRDGRRLHSSLPVRAERQLSLRSLWPLSGDTGVEHALRVADCDLGEQRVPAKPPSPPPTAALDRH